VLHVQQQQEGCLAPPFKQEDLRMLAGLQQLECLETWLSTRSEIAVVDQFPNLRRLGLVRFDASTAGSVTRLMTLRHLNGLALSTSLGSPRSTTDVIVAVLQALPELEELDVIGTVTDEFLARLAGLHRLRRLNLVQSYGFTDQGLAALVKGSATLEKVKYTPSSRPNQSNDPFGKNKEDTHNRR
jgi:hypothetical protein